MILKRKKEMIEMNKNGEPNVSDSPFLLCNRDCSGLRVRWQFSFYFADAIDGHILIDGNFFNRQFILQHSDHRIRFILNALFSENIRKISSAASPFRGVFCVCF